ncbi:MAG TPA: hypothetical protein VF444_01415 [Pseudonocardiaceae bacterium]
MSTATPPVDHGVDPADSVGRLAAVIRDEAARTRRLLLWIFVGIPLATACIALGYFAVQDMSASSHGSTPSYSTYSTQTSDAPGTADMSGAGSGSICGGLPGCVPPHG